MSEQRRDETAEHGTPTGYGGGGTSNDGTITGAGGGPGMAEAGNAPHDHPQANAPVPEEQRADAP